MNVGSEPEPVQVVEDAALEFRPAALAVVIFDPEQHTSRHGVGDPPNPFGIENVTEMEPAGRRRREARQRGIGQSPGERSDIKLIGKQQNRKSISGS